MTNSKLVFRTLTSLLFTSLFACASAEQKVVYPPGSDPQAKMTETSGRLMSDQSKQYDLLSPQHFSAAQAALTDAHQKSEKGAASDEILSDLGKANAQLQIVEGNGQKGSESLATVLTARSYAKAAKSDSVLPEEFKSADKQVRNLGQDIEDNSFQVDSTKLSKLEARYSELELLATKHNNLGETKSLIENAEKNGAKDKAPKTYASAQVLFASAARSIEANRRNPEAYRPSVELSVQSAQKLNQVLTTIGDSKTTEVAAVQIYDQQQQLTANQASLHKATMDAQEANINAQAANDAAVTKEAVDRQQINNLQGENQQYADKAALNQKIENIKSEFTPQEAIVVRDGNKIIVRLKSMKFSTSQFELTSTSLDTLQKVKEMIAAVSVTKVIVEGHTDSVGGEEKNMALSQKRAEAIKKYFLSEKSVPEDKLEAKGFGYEKPLTTNKTKEGRATNRRVDVVIETTSTI
jgi:OmpA-OmpF porin, OOP family